MSQSKNIVKTGSVPISRLIGKNKLDQLKSTFNTGKKPKTAKCDLNKLNVLASNKQKESYARGEQARTQKTTN